MTRSIDRESLIVLRLLPSSTAVVPPPGPTRVGTSEGLTAAEQQKVQSRGLAVLLDSSPVPHPLLRPRKPGLSHPDNLLLLYSNHA